MSARHVSPLESPFSWRHLATSENWADDDGDDQGSTDAWHSSCHFTEGASGASRTCVQSCGSCEPLDERDGEWVDWNPIMPSTSKEKAPGSPQEPDSEEEWGKWKPMPDKRLANTVPEPAQPPLRRKSPSSGVPEPANPPSWTEDAKNQKKDWTWKKSPGAKNQRKNNKRKKQR